MWLRKKKRFIDVAKRLKNHKQTNKRQKFFDSKYLPVEKTSPSQSRTQDHCRPRRLPGDITKFEITMS